MLKKSIYAGLLILFVSSGFALAQERTVIRDAKAKAMLLGKHRFSLQWISWDYFGTATVTEKRGVLYLKGEQKARKGSDYLRVNGVITRVDAKEFKFDGKIEMRVSHINGGEPCTREGEMTFRISGKRRFWRLAEMDNPCDTATDYVDIFFR